MLWFEKRTPHEHWAAQPALPDRDRRHQDRVVVGDARANLVRQHAAERADERTDERACVVAGAVSGASCLGVAVD